VSPASGTYWRTLRKDPFIVNYLANTPFEDVDLVIKRFEASRKTLQKYFGEKFKFRVEIVIYPSAGDFTVSTGHPWWHGAAWLDGKVHLQPPRVLSERGALNTTITHEYAHLALADVTKGNTPLWFEEGFAAYASGEFDNGYKKKPADFTWDKDIAALEKSLAQTKDQDASERAYKAAWLMVKNMHEKHGKKKMLELYKQAKEQKNFDKALKTVLKTDAKNIVASIKPK
jgi:hypothetical protein